MCTLLVYIQYMDTCTQCQSCTPLQYVYILGHIYIYSIYFLWNATFLLASLFVQVHRALMLIALAFSVAGFILIFVALRNSGNPNGLITLGVSECGHFHC